MSIPAWQYKLEDVEFKMRDKPVLIVDWLLSHPSAREIPDDIRQARLLKYGYKPTPVVESEVQPEVKTRIRNPRIKPMSTQERQASVQRQMRNKDD